MRHINIDKAWWAVLLMGIGLFLPLFPESAAAAGNYSFIDSSDSAIIGPGPGTTSGQSLTYSKKAGSSTEYDSKNLVTPAGAGINSTASCYPKIVLYGAGSDNGTLSCTDASGFDLVSSSDSSITIVPFTKAGSGGGKGGTSGAWVDHSTINVNGTQYTDTSISNDLCYGINPQLIGDCSSVNANPSTVSAAACSQYNYINRFPGSLTGGDPQNAKNTAKITTWTPSGNQCNSSTVDITFTDQQNFNIYFDWADSGTIDSSDGQLIFTQQTSSGTYSGSESTYAQTQSESAGVTTCQNTITADSAIPSTGTLVLENVGSNSSTLGTGWPSNIMNANLQGSGTVGTCYQSNPITVQIGDPTVTINGTTAKASTQPAGSSASASTTSTGNGSGSSNASPTLSCDVTWNPLTWLLCPAVDGMVSIVGDLDNVISSELDVGNSSNCSASDQPCQIFGGSTNGNAAQSSGAYYDAWSSFRDIALGLMVVVGLIILIAQALGFELLDAYAIRKTLPRLIIAAVGISLSWPIMSFLVTLTNDLGFGIRYLIYEPFINAHLSQATLNGGGQVASNLIGSVAIVALGIFGLLTFAATAALAVFVAFLVLVLRQLLIIILIVIAPIAIVAYILPNTQRVYKLWWESFSKALLMFPLIAAFIASGRVFAVVATSNGNSQGGFGSTLGDLAGFAAYFLPYFVLPMTFRFAGGLMSQAGNLVNSRAQGGFGALKKYRAGQVQKNAGLLKSGERFKGKTWIPGSIKAANRFGAVSQGIGTGWNGRFGLPTKRGKEARGFAAQAALEAAMQRPEIKAIAGKNDYNRILAMAMGNENEGRKALAEHLATGGDDGKTFLDKDSAESKARVDAAATAARVVGFTKPNAAAAFMNMAKDGTAIRDVDDLAWLAATVGDNNANNTFTYASLAARYSKGAGRPGLSPATEQLGELAYRASDRIFKHEGEAKLYTGRKDDRQLKTAAKLSAYGNTQAYERFTQSKGRDLRNEHSFLAELMENKDGIYSPDEIEQAAAHMADARSAIDSGLGAGNKRAAAIEAMGASGIAAHDEYMSKTTDATKVEESLKREYVKRSPSSLTTEERVSKEQTQRPQTRRDVVADKYGGGRQGQQNINQDEMVDEANRNRPQDPNEQ